jgi:GNAT superfamily N-acetyltransferase
MLYTGPWHDVIVGLNLAQRAALAKRIAQETAGSRPDAVQHDVGSSAQPLPRDLSMPLQGDWIGVRTNDGICAVLAHGATFERIGRRVGSPAIVEVAMWVDPQFRRRGMAVALVQQCIAIKRQAGASHLVFNGVENDEALRKLLRRFSTDLVFTCGTCQAWLELGAASAPATKPVLVG